MFQDKHLLSSSPAADLWLPAAVESSCLKAAGWRCCCCCCFAPAGVDPLCPVWLWGGLWIRLRPAQTLRRKRELGQDRVWVGTSPSLANISELLEPAPPRAKVASSWLDWICHLVLVLSSTRWVQQQNDNNKKIWKLGNNEPVWMNDGFNVKSFVLVCNINPIHYYKSGTLVWLFPESHIIPRMIAFQTQLQPRTDGFIVCSSVSSIYFIYFVSSVGQMVITFKLWLWLLKCPWAKHRTLKLLPMGLTAPCMAATVINVWVAEWEAALRDMKVDTSQ